MVSNEIKYCPICENKNLLNCEWNFPGYRIVHYDTDQKVCTNCFAGQELYIQYFGSYFEFSIVRNNMYFLFFEYEKSIQVELRDELYSLLYSNSYKISNLTIDIINKIYNESLENFLLL